MGEVRDILFQDGEEKEHHTSEICRTRLLVLLDCERFPLRKGVRVFYLLINVKKLYLKSNLIIHRARDLVLKN